MKIEADVVEEIARAVGYDRIEAVVPHITVTDIPSDDYDREQQVARAAATFGYKEIVTFALQPAAIRTAYDNAGVELPRLPVEIMNPLSEDQRFMRFSILPAILELASRGTHELPLRTFELGHVFGNVDGSPQETAMLVWALIAKPGDEPAWRDSNFLRFKAEAEAIVQGR